MLCSKKFLVNTFLRIKNIKNKYQQPEACSQSSEYQLDMVWTMSADNEKTVGAVVGEESVIRKAKTNKYLIIGVSSVIVAVLILIGILVGIYLFTETFNKIVTQNLKTKNSDQDVSVDLTANIIQYDVKGKDNVDDYNSFLRVAKITVGNEIVCYADFMNGTDKVDLTKVIKTTDTIESNNKVYYERVGSPIPDNSFMNTKSRKLCKGISTYWVKESCNRQLENQKQKRDICYHSVYRSVLVKSGERYYHLTQYIRISYIC